MFEGDEQLAERVGLHFQFGDAGPFARDAQKFNAHLFGAHSLLLGISPMLSRGARRLGSVGIQPNVRLKADATSEKTVRYVAVIFLRT